MSVADNKQLVLFSLECLWGKRDLVAYGEHLAQELVAHTEGPVSREGRAVGHPEFLHAMTELVAAFPDMSCAVEDIFGEADRVAIRWTMEGTHSGAPLGKTQPTGRRVVWRGGTVVRIEAGRIAELWTYSDDVSLLTQLGVLSRPPPSPPPQ